MRNTNTARQIFLASGDLDCAGDSFHISKISAAVIQRQQRRWWQLPRTLISVPNMGTDKHRHAKVGPLEKAAAQRLKAIWKARRGWDKELTQEAIGARLQEEWGRKTGQSTISQYLNGNIPLNVAATLFFARHLECGPAQIRDLAEMEPELRYWSLTRRDGAEEHPQPPQVDATQPDDGRRTGIKEPTLRRRRTPGKRRA